MGRSMFGYKYRQKPSGIDYSRPQGVGMRSPRAFMIAAILCLILVLMVAKKLYVLSHSPPRMPETPMVFDTALPPMPEPDLAQAPPLPGDEAIAAEATAAAEDVGSNPRLPVPEPGPSPYALAAAESAMNVTADQAYAADSWELTRDKIGLGVLVRVTGKVLWSGSPQAGSTWRRTIVETDPDVFVEALSREDLPIGRVVDVTGFYLGQEMLPTAKQPAAYPVIAARLVAENAAASSDEGSLAAVKDEKLSVEPGPYRALLRQVAQDPPAAHAESPSLNYLADAIHRDPDAHRGKSFKVNGNVLRAWVDEQVTRDHPELGRVVRMLLYHKDLAPQRKNVGGRDVDRTVQVQRFYDLAARSDLPLPKENDPIIAQGRFLKFLARPLDREANPEKAHSNRVYSLMLVSNGFEVAELDVPLPFFNYGIMLVAMVLIIILIRHAVHVSREASALQQASKANEEVRKNIREKSRH
jgi:hypothetical protein